jgi:hypothetical protein
MCYYPKHIKNIRDRGQKHANTSYQYYIRRGEDDTNQHTEKGDQVAK